MSHWSSLKFKIAEELGECMDYTYIHFNPDTSEKKFSHYHHYDHDGMSSISDLFKQKGFSELQQPQLKDSKNPPTATEKIKSLFSYIKLTKKVPFSWKRKKLDQAGQSLGFSFSYFSKEDTSQIKKYCKENRVSTTTLFLSTLDKVVTDTLLEPGSVRKWVSPINMRGGVVSGNAKGNYSASIIINADDSFDEKRWQMELLKYLKNRVHWGAWIYTNMAKFIGEKGAKHMARKLRDLAVGVFSNMGEWPLPGQETPDSFDQNIVITPNAPASQLMPIAAVSTIWYGRLALTMRVHPSLQLSQIECEQLHNDWAREISDRVQVEPNTCEFITKNLEYN